MPSILQALSARQRSQLSLSLCLAASCLWLSPANGQDAKQGADTKLAIRVGTIHPISGPVIENAVILVSGKRISRIGLQGEVTIPEDAKIIDLPRAHAYPGIVDAMSGAYLDARERNNRAVDGGTRIVDGLNPFNQLSHGLAKAGVTTAYVSNHSEGVWRGLGTIVRPGPNGYAAMVGKETAGLGVRMTSGKTPGHVLTRKAALEAIGKSFEALEAYKKSFTKHAKAKKKYEEDFATYLEYHSEKKGEDEGAAKESAEKPAKPKPKTETKPAPSDAKSDTDKAADKTTKAPKRPKYPKAPKKDPAKEALLRAKAGDIPLRVEAHRQDEILALLALTREHDIPRPVLEHATAAGELADKLAAAGVPVLLADIDTETAKLYGAKQGARLAAQLSNAGVPFAFTSGGSIRRGRHLPLMAAIACGHGLSEAAALRAITLTPAEILGVAEDIGSLDEGKIADIIISSGPLLRSDSRILRVFSAGNLHYETN